MYTSFPNSTCASVLGFYPFSKNITFLVRTRRLLVRSLVLFILVNDQVGVLAALKRTNEQRAKCGERIKSKYVNPKPFASSHSRVYLIVCNVCLPEIGRID